MYLDVNYKFVPWFNLTVRNRYNHNNYSSTDLSGELDNNDTYEIGTYWNFKITDKFSYTFEPHYFMRVNDFNSSNGKDHHWEITNTFRYRINRNWLPYFELRWLDRNVEPYHREQTRSVSGRSISSDVKRRMRRKRLIRPTVDTVFIGRIKHIRPLIKLQPPASLTLANTLNQHYGNHRTTECEAGHNAKHDFVANNPRI